MIDINEARVYDITKEYTSMYRVTSYKYGFDPTKKKEKHKKYKIPTPTDMDESLQVSVRRSRRAISDYVRCNQFELFVTLTFDPSKVDRYDLLGTYLKMQGWLHRQSRKHDDFKYLIVPERHKDGAIHFHALMAGIPEDKLKKTRVIQNNKRVYNLLSFKFGFTNVQYLDEDIDKTTAYVCKYITKDMELISNRRRYWCSRNLRKPIKSYNFIFRNPDLDRFLTPDNLVVDSDYNQIYEFPKPSFD